MPRRRHLRVTTPPYRNPSKPRAADALRQERADVRRALNNPHQSASLDLLALQRSAGNRAVAGLLRSTAAVPSVQAKLPVGPEEDVYEREADRVSESVMRMPDAGGQVIQRKPDGGGGGSGAPAASGTSAGGPGPQSLSLHAGGGKSLPATARSFMENRFGTDFGNVRVHTDSQSVQMNRALHSHAFTRGNDVYFAPGRFRPETDDGKKLLAHELTHVVQQTRGRQVQRNNPTGAPDGSQVEHAASSSAIAMKKMKVLLDFIRLKRKKDLNPRIVALMKKLGIKHVQERMKGHWWAEIGDMHEDFKAMRWDSKESYGWWPPKELGGGSQPDVVNPNGVAHSLGNDKRDPLHLSRVGRRDVLHPVMEVDSKKDYREVRGKLETQIRKAAVGNQDAWQERRGWGANSVQLLERMAREFKWNKYQYKEADGWLRNPDIADDEQEQQEPQENVVKDDNAIPDFDVRIW